MIELVRTIFAPPRHLILLVAALWLGLWLSERRAGQHGVPKDPLSNMAFYSLLGYILGGRMLYALANYSEFLRSPSSLFSLNLDLFDPLSASAAGLIVAFVYGSRQKLPFWPTLDALTPLFASLAAGLSLAHLAAGTAFGRPTSLPWGMWLWNETRHPTQLYELLAALLIFALLWFRNRITAPGLYFVTFLALTAGARLFLEAFRGDSILVLGGFRLAQILAWLVLAAAFVVRDHLLKQADSG